MRTELAAPRDWRWTDIALPLLAVAVLGAVHLPHPLHGDAALYQSGARAMQDGQVLYRDFWDLKQPGIYAFHWLAGNLFSFSELGLHAAELVLLLALSWWQIVTLRWAFAPASLSALVPIAGVGAYYAVVTDWHLTQPAILLSVPLFLVLMALCSTRGPRPLRWALAGVAGAVATTFKFVVLPVVLGLAVAALVINRREAPTGWRTMVFGRLLPLVGGIALVWGVILAWLAAHDAFAPFVWTHLQWRPLSHAEFGFRPSARVRDSVVWFVHGFWPWLALAALSPLGWRGARAERAFILAAVWCVSGVAAVLAEPFAGWEFDFLLLAVPVGMLAVRGIQGLLGVLRGPLGLSALPTRAVAAALVLLAFLPGGRRWSSKAGDLARNARQLAGNEYEYQRAINARYEAAWRSTAFLRSDSSAPGPIYVFGDPIVQLLSERPSASSVHGWAWELQPPSVWQRVHDELRDVAPPYIFVEHVYRDMIRERSPALQSLLSSRYAQRAADTLGVWLAIAPASAAPR